MITPAIIHWDDKNVPYSPLFQDIYFSRENGLAETEHVFIQGNQLVSRWEKLDSTQIFLIAETGFGTGLNFLATWQAWSQCADFPRLHYISIEKHPLILQDLQKCLYHWEHLQEKAAALLQVYPPLVAGCHRRFFAQGRLILDLWFGDVNHILPHCLHSPTAGVDAWYLDGFAPAKNPAMWNATLYAHIRRLSKPDATFSTYTAVGAVRRELSQAGFIVQKMAGFGKKRERLQGIINPDSNATMITPPYYHLPPAPTVTREAIIIGGGLAGLTTTYSLLQRGWQCTLLEQQATVGQGGSGNRQGIFYPLLSTQPTDLPAQFYWTAYLHTLQRLQILLQQVDFKSFNLCGVLQLNPDKRAEQRAQAILSAWHLPEKFLQYIDAEKAREICNLSISYSALYFPQAGWLATRELCEAYLTLLKQYVNFTFHSQTTATHLLPITDGWQVVTPQRIFTAPVVILANAHAAQTLLPQHPLNLHTLRGQVTYPIASPLSTDLKAVLCYNGFITPAYQHQHCLGATYQRDSLETIVRDEDNQENMQQLQKVLPDFAATLNLATATARCSLRCSSADHLPLIGGLADYAEFIKTYHDLADGKRWTQYAKPPYQSGLYVTLAHGSRGLISTPLAGEIIASLLTDESLPIPLPVLNAVSPQRFWIRALKNI